MKTLCVLFLLLTLPLRGVELTLEWDAPSPEAAVASYSIWERTGPDGSWVKIGTTAGAATDLKLDFAPGAHTVHARAHDAAGASSEPSEPLTFTVPNKPGKPRIKLTLQASDDLSEWTDLVTVLEPAESRRFYRAVLAAP